MRIEQLTFTGYFAIYNRSRSSAKSIKKRFSETIIQEIEDLKWWDLSEVGLKKIRPLFFKDFTNSKSIYN
jgi:hypothetical protein